MEKASLDVVMFNSDLMQEHYNNIKTKGLKPQTIKNRLYQHKVNGRYEEYLALQAAYHKYKLWLEL